jgi:hypothetical protein
MTIPSALSRKDRALQLLEQMQAEIKNDQLDNAVEQFKQLSQHFSEWQRSEHIQTARAWLEAALENDLLTFDAGIAQEHLEKWKMASESSEENPELAQYREQVAARIKEKNDALLVRGVISHCDELLTEALSLQASHEPPAPDFMMKRYFAKARDITIAAQTEHEGNADLERLVQRVERIYNNNQTAAVIYRMALETQKYSNALHNLGQLPQDNLIPRFSATDDGNGDIKLQYQSMVNIESAREEITRLAKSWASSTLGQSIKMAQQYLEAHEPQEAIDELDLGDNVEKFLEAEQKEQLQKAQSEATSQLRKCEKAEEKAAQVLSIAAEDAHKAWDQYAAAYHLYQWAEGIEEARQAAVKALRIQLKAMVRQADGAFHENRDMAKVRQLSEQAKANYANKDATLDELLEQFNEFDEMVQSYEEYIMNGNQILGKVKQVVHEDSVAANDLLSQVESYPEFVLAAFDNLYDLRTLVNQRLNADQSYSQLYPALFHDAVGNITEAIEKAKEAVEEFPNDGRFPQLVQWLQFHMAYLSAYQQAEHGAIEHAMQLLTPVLSSPKHPDHDDAQKLYQQLQAAKQQRESKEDGE